MASRAQRRAMRRAQGAADGAPADGAAEGGFSQRARQRQAQVRPAQQPPKTQTGRAAPPQRGRFVKESVAELRKVEWPGRPQIIQGTAVVLLACAIVGLYLWVNDLIWQRVVEAIL